MWPILDSAGRPTGYWTFSPPDGTPRPLPTPIFYPFGPAPATFDPNLGLNPSGFADMATRPDYNRPNLISGRPTGPNPMPSMAQGSAFFPGSDTTWGTSIVGPNARPQISSQPNRPIVGTAAGFQNPPQSQVIVVNNNGLSPTQIIKPLLPVIVTALPVIVAVGQPVTEAGINVAFPATTIPPSGAYFPNPNGMYPPGWYVFPGPGGGIAGAIVYPANAQGRPVGAAVAGGSSLSPIFVPVPGNTGGLTYPTRPQDWRPYEPAPTPDTTSPGPGGYADWFWQRPQFQAPSTVMVPPPPSLYGPGGDESGFWGGLRPPPYRPGPSAWTGNPRPSGNVDLSAGGTGGAAGGASYPPANTPQTIPNP